MPVSLLLKVLPHGRDLPLPRYETSGSAGMDLRAAEALTLAPMARAAVSTGFAIAVPDGYEAQVRPRSGLSLKRGLTVANAPGTIDSDYRGEVKVILINLGKEDFVIERGMRVAQMVIAPVKQVDICVVDTLDETDRGSGGFGSTGT